MASNNDSRMKYIQLTTLGQQEVQRLPDCQREQISHLFSKLTPTEVEALSQALVQIRNQLTKANDVVTIRSFNILFRDIKRYITLSAIYQKLFLLMWIKLSMNLSIAIIRRRTV